ncbi:hypothetical protein Tco_0991051 [Tanacetum coccineum]|uniref:Retrovirus-related Pol polyprotein from transposon TNT 1-94 n=1 Tax=Tanacetum coccineum TaxID=301880 RepID=A0ABQ5EYJ9_9ASTR
MAVVNDVPQLVDKKGGSYAAIAPKLEPENLINKRRAVVQDQRLKSIIMSCLPDDIMKLVISCVSTKETWTDLVHSCKGPSDTKENRIMDLKLEYQTFKAKSTESLSRTYTCYKTLLNELANNGVNLSKHEINISMGDIFLSSACSFLTSCVSAKETWTDLVHSFEGPSNTKENKIMDLKLKYRTFRSKSTESLSQTYTRYKTLLNELSNDGDNLSKHEINVGFVNSLPEKWLTFSQSSSNLNNQADPKFQKDYKAEYKKMKAKLALLEASLLSSQNPKNFQPKNKGLVAETFDWDEEEVFDEEEVTQVKVLIALADDELIVRKSHARNSEEVDITIRKRLNLLSKYNKMVFELNKCRHELLILKQTKLDAVTFQIQNTKLIKLNHALQEQLKEEKKINELKKVSQCISEQIPHQKKKVLGGELLIESSSKKNENENLFVHASMGYDQEMVPKTKGWVERLNPDNKLPNFNTRRILVPEIQAINESLEPNETLNTLNHPKIMKLNPLLHYLP